MSPQVLTCLYTNKSVVRARQKKGKKNPANLSICNSKFVSEFLIVPLPLRWSGLSFRPTLAGGRHQTNSAAPFSAKQRAD